MKRFLINADIGEKGIAHSIDEELFEYIDIANIAVGGHAGNQESADYYLYLCKKFKVTPTLHLSYPDRENFGRKIMLISFEDLLNSLDAQRELLAEVKTVKFHGMLYHDSAWDQVLAGKITSWLINHGIKEILLPGGSPLEQLALDNDITVQREIFADRYYQFNNQQLSLIPRGSEIPSSIEHVQDFKRQIDLFQQGIVSAYEPQEKKWQEHPIEGNTICLHSDHPKVQEFAAELSKALKH